MKYPPIKNKYKDDLEVRLSNVKEKIKVLDKIVYTPRPIDESFFKDSKKLNDLFIEKKTIESRLDHFKKGSDVVEINTYFPSVESKNKQNQI